MERRRKIKPKMAFEKGHEVVSYQWDGDKEALFKFTTEHDIFAHIEVMGEILLFNLGGMSGELDLTDWLIFDTWRGFDALSDSDFRVKYRLYGDARRSEIESYFKGERE